MCWELRPLVLRQLRCPRAATGDTNTDRDRDRQIAIQTDRQTDSYTDRRTDRQAGRLPDRQTLSPDGGREWGSRPVVV